MKKSILFFGELFPNTIHGIAMSNSRVVAILEKEFKIFVVEENSKLEEHNKLGILKAIKKLNIIFKATYYSIISRFNYFYSPFFNSTFGSLKLLPIVLIFKLFNPKAKIILHLHGNLHYSFLQKWYNVFIAKLLFKLANNVICLCPTQVKDMEQTFPTIHYFNFLYNTVFEPYNEIKAPIKSVDYIFISNYLVSKGIFDLLEAIKTTEMSLVTHGRFANDDIKTKIESYGKKNKNLIKNTFC